MTELIEQYARREPAVADFLQWRFTEDHARALENQVGPSNVMDLDDQDLTNADDDAAGRGQAALRGFDRAAHLGQVGDLALLGHRHVQQHLREALHGASELREALFALHHPGQDEERRQ